MIIPETGQALELHPEQRAVLNAMSERDADGRFKYTTWLYSAPKKSAKTTLGAGVAMWQAWQIPDSQVYIVGNDLKQSDSRMSQAIRYAIEHHPTMKAHAEIIKYNVRLSNGTVIESVPVDPTGEAGANPSGIFLTEAWGAKQKKHELMWAEMTLSPTRAGQAFRFVESYAGHVGESIILENLYEQIVKNGTPHPIIPEVYTNGGMIGYWCTRRYLSWQVNNPAYYIEEAALKPAQEFSRQHENAWVTSSDAFIQPEWWDACLGDMPPHAANEQMVIALDAAVSGDCFALVGVTRRGEILYTRAVHIWQPTPGKRVDFRDVEATLKALAGQYNVICVTYDPFQLHDFATRLQEELGIWFDEFPQTSPRLEADVQLRHLIMARRVAHDGNTELRAHILNADAKTDGDHKLRIVKRNERLKIDAAVALSMATSRALDLDIG